MRMDRSSPDIISGQELDHLLAHIDEVIAAFQRFFSRSAKARNFACRAGAA